MTEQTAMPFTKNPRTCRYGKNGYFGICGCPACRAPGGPEGPKLAPPANALIAETIVTAIECRFRDWLMSGEHQEAVALVTEILNDKKPDRA